MGDDTFAFGKTSASSATDLNCTANDIEIATAVIQGWSETGAPGSFVPPPAGGIDCAPGKTIFVDIKANLRNNAQSRYDIGVWVESNPNNTAVEMHGDKGEVILSKAVTGACTHYNLVVGKPGVSSLETPDNLKDSCGDMAEGSGLAELDLDVIAVTCEDPDLNGKVEVSNCIGWQNVDGDASRVCPSPGTNITYRFGTTPNNKAKCNCTPMSLNINIAASLDIEKISLGGTETFDYTVSGAPLVPFSRTTTTAGVATATDPVLITSANFGDKYVTESAKTGWTLTNISCTAGGAVIAIGTGQGAAFSEGTTSGFDAGDNTVKVTVTSADSPACTFTNTKDASVDIEKISLGGTETFDYTVSGTPLVPFTRTTTTAGVATTTAPVTVTAANFGDKYVTESAETGYTLTNIACTANGAVIAIGTGQGGAFSQGTTSGFDAGDNTVKITVDASDTPTCTFTNTKDASVDIEKVSVGGTETFDYSVSGTPLVAFSRTTTTSGVATTTAPVTVTAANFGDKYVTESAETGFTLTNISCTANGAVIAIGTGQGGAFSEGTTSGFDAGDNTVKITVDAGDTPTCTFENTLGASVDIEKVSLGGIETFDYTVSGAPLAPFTRTTTTAGVPTATAPVAISPANFGDKYVTESAETGYTLTNIACTANGAVIAIGTGQGGAFSQGTTSGFDAGDNTVKITVDAGDNPTCTFTNTKDASVDIEKISLGGTETFDYTVSGTPLVPFTRTTTTAGVATTTAPVTVTAANFGDKYVSESAETGYTLTNIACTANGAVIAIGTGQGGAFSEGTTSGFDAGDNTVKLTVDAGDTPTCTFTNTKQGSIKIVKDAKTPETDAEIFSFTATGTGMTPTSFDLNDDGEVIVLSNERTFTGLLPNGARTVTEGAEANWTLTNMVCTGQVTSTIAYLGASGGTNAYQAGDNQVSIGLAAGENIVCTFTNQRKARLIIEKSFPGSAQVFDFSRTGISDFTLSDGQSNNSGFTLAPGDYTVCEKSLAVAFSATGEAGNTGAISGVTLVNPDLPADNGTRCYTFTGLTYGDDKTIRITNHAPPGGDARTIGYWKNWSSCTGGNQYTKAQARGELDRTLNFYIDPPSAAVFPIGLITDLNCAEAVNLLDKRPISANAKKAASDPVYNMVAQLFAAKLNYAAGAAQCAAVTTAMSQAQTLLVALNFTGTAAYKNVAQAAQLNTLATLFDQYNNNTLACS
jgi:hypothetical protein